MKKNSLSDNIYEDLKDKILFNHLRPGDMISEQELAERYFVSRTPVRQAIQKLSNYGLVSVKHGSGTFVTFLSQKDVADAYEIRNFAERIAAKSSVFSIKNEELDPLEEQFTTLKTQLSRGGFGASFDKIVKTDWALHDLLVEKCDNSLLKHMIYPVNLVLRRYQYSYVSIFERAMIEHLEIVRAVREKDIDTLDQLLDEHIRFKPI